MRWKHVAAAVLGIALGVGSALLLRRWRDFGEPAIDDSGALREVPL